MTDPEIIDKAIALLGLSDRQFARVVLGVNPQTVSNWRRGKWAIGPAHRRLLLLFIERPEMMKVAYMAHRANLKREREK